MKKAWVVFFVIFFLTCLSFAAKTSSPHLSKNQKILQVLNRLTFGTKPEDVTHVRKIGIQKYIEEQLNPGTLKDAQCEKDLKSYETLDLSSFEIYQKYPPPKDVFKQDRKNGKMPTQAEVKAVRQELQTIYEDLSEGKLTRMVESRKQLLEIMDDFWFNHFNVSFQKNRVKWALTSYERDVIRANALGKFKDLLSAVAHSAAMLEYLDNVQSVVDARYVPQDEMSKYSGSMQKQMSGEVDGKKRKVKKGLNENYARELMELHTLGVDGGYSQKDVIEVARILTGWSFGYPQEFENKKIKENEVFQFKFRENQHDKGTKTVMGKTYGPNKGEQEGQELLEFLSRQPATAHFIATKLCRRFLCDDPPAEVVEKVAQRFLDTDGDIKETLRAIFESPEFMDPQYYRAKVKTPLEFLVSALRVTDARLDDPLKVSRLLNNMGEQLYYCEPPTGYPDTAKAWVSSSALLGRLNFGMSLLRQNPNDPDSPYSVDMNRFVPHLSSDDGKAILKDFFKAFLGGDLSQGTQEALFKKLKDPEVSHAVLDDRHKRFEAVQLGALVLGSPEFQRR